MDKLREIVEFYETALIKKTFVIKIGKKGVAKELKIRFDGTHFKHLLGIHKLKGLSLYRQSSISLVQEIKNEKLKLEELKLDKAYFEIQDRIESFYLIETMLKEKVVVKEYTYQSERKFFNSIEADYILTVKNEFNENAILFIKQGENGLYSPITFFVEKSDKYFKSTIKWTVLDKYVE